MSDTEDNLYSTSDSEESRQSLGFVDNPPRSTVAYKQRKDFERSQSSWNTPQWAVSPAEKEEFYKASLARINNPEITRIYKASIAKERFALSDPGGDHQAGSNSPLQGSREDAAGHNLLKLAADVGASEEVLSTLMGSLPCLSDSAVQVGCESSSSGSARMPSSWQRPVQTNLPSSLQVLRDQLMLGPGCDVFMVRLLLKTSLSADMLNTEFNFAIPGVGLEFEDVLSPFVAALLSGVPLQVLEVLLEANPGDAKSVVPAPLAAAALVLLRSNGACEPISIPVNGQVSWVGIKGSGPVELHVPGNRISTAGSSSSLSSTFASANPCSHEGKRCRDTSLTRARQWPQCQLSGVVTQCLRPRVGDRVRAAQRSSFSGVLRDGSLGLVERDDGSSKPFRVRGPNGQSSWYIGEELQVVDPGISRLQTLRHSFVPALHVAMLAGAPVSLLRELIRLNPEAVIDQFALNIPLLHVVLLNQESYSAADWSALALDVLRADESAAAVRISSSFPIAVAVQLCGDKVHQEFLIQLALAYLPGYRATCQQLGVEGFDGLPPATDLVKSVKHLCQSVANCKIIFQELKRGRWCDQSVVVRCLEETPKVVRWRIAGEYFLWWSLHFGAPCEVVNLWLKVYPEAARHSRSKRSVPMVPLAIAKRYSSHLITKLAGIAPENACFGDQVKTEQIRCVCEPCSPLQAAALSASESLTSLELALHMNASDDILHSLLDMRAKSEDASSTCREKSSLTDSRTHDPHKVSADSLLMLALRREGCSIQLLEKFLRPERRSLVGALMAISESPELKAAIPHHNLRLLLSLASGEDADAAKVAAGSLALKRELEKAGAASADSVDKILKRYPPAVASVRIKPQPGSRITYGTRPWNVEATRNSGMLPIEYALHLDVPVQALRHLIHAYPEAASVPFESTSDLREGSAQQYLLHHAVRKMRAAFAMVHADLSALLGSEATVEDHAISLASAMQFSTHMQWAYLVREVFDTAPAVAMPTWIDSAMGEDDMMQPFGSPLFDLLCMRREIMGLVVPLLEHLLSVSPALASSLDEEGRTPLLAAVMHRAPRTVIQVLLRACPEAAGMASRQWKPPFSHIIDACHSGRSGCCRESWSSYLIPTRDWARERLIWLAHQKPVRKPSTANSVSFADLPDLAIGKICGGLGAPSVAWLLFQSAPRVIEHQSLGSRDRTLLEHELGRSQGSVDSAFVIKAVQLLLCRCSRPFDARLVQAMLERCPEAAQQHLYIEAGNNKELRCLPLHAVLRNQATCAVTLAEFLLELFPGSGEVEDSEGWLPLSLALTLPLPWARIKGLTEKLLQAATEKAGAPWRQHRWRSVRCPEDGDLLFGTLVDVESFGLANIASQGIVLEGRHMGQYEVEYNTGVTSYIRPEEIKRVCVFTSESPEEDERDCPPWRRQRPAIGVGGAPILLGLLNNQVPTFVLVALMHQQPEDLILYDKSVGTALELALRRSDADQLVLPMLELQPRLASMALSERAFAEVDRCSRLPVALALKLHARAEVVMALVQANPECCEEANAGSVESQRITDSACDVLEELLRPHGACQANSMPKSVPIGNVRWVLRPRDRVQEREDFSLPVEDEGSFQDESFNDFFSQETDLAEQLMRQHLSMMWNPSASNEQSNHQSDSDAGRDLPWDGLLNDNSSESSLA